MVKESEKRGRPPKYEVYSDAAKTYRQKLKASGMVAITAYVPQPIKAKLEKLCKETGKTQSEVLSHLLIFEESKHEEFLSLFDEDG